MRSQLLIYFLFVCGGMLGGCTHQPAQTDYRLFTTSVTPLEYGKILCRGVVMADYHTCVTTVMEHYKDALRTAAPPQPATGGPFVLVFNDGMQYHGRYTSSPFMAQFDVANGKEFCHGQYNAFAGDHTAIFQLRCHADVTGTADIILDHTGRNGIGVFRLSNGKQGQIVFGYAAVME